jgi:hypothetical protein
LLLLDFVVRKREKPPELSRWRLKNFRKLKLYGAPRVVISELMTGMDRMQQARRCRGRACWVERRSCRVAVTVFVILS